MLSKEAPFEMGAFGTGVARVGAEEPVEQLPGGVTALWQQHAQHARELGTGDREQISPPRPAGGSAGRRRQARPG